MMIRDQMVTTFEVYVELLSTFTFYFDQYFSMLLPPAHDMYNVPCLCVVKLSCDSHMITRDNFSTLRDQYLFSGSVDHSIKMWNIERLEVVASMPAHDNPVCTLTINGNRLYSGSLKSIKVSG